MRRREIYRNHRQQKVAKMRGLQKEKEKGDRGTTAIKLIGMRRIGKATIGVDMTVLIPVRGIENGKRNERKPVISRWKFYS